MASVRIVERRTNKIVEAELVPDVSLQQAAEAEHLWSPYRSQKRSSGEPSVGSDGWDWGLKRGEAEAGVHRISGILCEGRMQGMMLLRTKPVRSRRPNSENARVLYVEYLEAAPWNQERYVGNDAHYGAVGVVLLKHAIHESDAAGCNGEIRLLSLREAETYYRPWFLDVGIDRVEGLRYFEMTALLAQNFLEGKRSK